jgi:dolichol-phosphate mannosyltransferase
MISLVVPLFNEEDLVAPLHDRVSEVMAALGEPWQVVYVNDGSRDRTLDLLIERQRTDPHIMVVELSRNWGHQPAVTAGLSLAEGDAVVLMDGDLQDPPEVIPEMVESWRQGHEVVLAARRDRGETGLRRWLFPLFYKLLGFVSDYPIPLNAGIFGLLDRRVVDTINGLTETNRYLPGLRSWVGFRTGVVWYSRPERAGGKPKQTLFKLIRYGLDAIFSFSYKPLRLSLALGLLTSVLAMIYGAILIACRLMGVGLFGQPVVIGYTSTIVAILMLGGVQLICIGILGEYIGRVYDEVKRRPLFIVRQVHRRS